MKAGDWVCKLPGKHTWTVVPIPGWMISIACGLKTGMLSRNLVVVAPVGFKNFAPDMWKVSSASTCLAYREEARRRGTQNTIMNKSDGLLDRLNYLHDEVVSCGFSS